MTELDLDAIQARADAATPGPWHLDDEHIGVWTSAEGALGGAVCEPSDLYARGPNHPLENMRFVAHARQDIPLLVAEVRRTTRLLEIVRRLHKPVDIEPSETICAECSTRLSTGEYQPFVEHPCLTIRLLEGEDE